MQRQPRARLGAAREGKGGEDEEEESSSDGSSIFGSKWQEAASKSGGRGESSLRIQDLSFSFPAASFSNDPEGTHGTVTRTLSHRRG